MRPRRLASLLVLLFFPALALAWGDLGHRLVGALAEDALRPATRERALGQAMVARMRSTFGWRPGVPPGVISRTPGQATV